MASLGHFGLGANSFEIRTQRAFASLKSVLPTKGILFLCRPLNAIARVTRDNSEYQKAKVSLVTVKLIVEEKNYHMLLLHLHYQWSCLVHAHLFHHKICKKEVS